MGENDTGSSSFEWSLQWNNDTSTIENITNGFNSDVWTNETVIGNSTNGTEGILLNETFVSDTFVNDTNARRPALTEEEAALLSSNDSDLVRETLRVYGSLYLASLLVYTILRRWYPRLFNIRSWANYNWSRNKESIHCSSCNPDSDQNDEDPQKNSSTNNGRNYSISSASSNRSDRRSELLAQQQYGTFSWFYEVFHVTDAQLLDHCGMDAVCFLRALRFGTRLCLVGCFNAVWLLPVYATSREAAETAYLVDPLVLVSLSHVPSASPRFIGTVLASYIFYLSAFYFILAEYKWFIAVRHAFLARPEPRNYAVYVSGIPVAHQSSPQLAAYFGGPTCNGGDKRSVVVQAHVAMETPLLDGLVARRTTAMQALEHAVAVERRQFGPRVIRRRGVSEARENFELLHRQVQEQQRLHVTRIDDSARGGRRAQLQRTQRQTQCSMIDHEAADKDQLLQAIREDVDSCEFVAESTRFLTGRRPPLRQKSKNEKDGDNKDSCDFDEASSRCEGKAQGKANDGRHVYFSSGEPTERDSSPDLSPVLSSESRKSNDVEMQRIEPDLGADDSLGHSETSLRTSERSHRSSASSRRQRFSDSLASGTKSVVGGINQVGTTFANGSRAASVTLAKTGNVVGTHMMSGTKAVGTTLVKKSQNVGSTVLESAGAVVPLLLQKTEGRPRDAGFIVFNSLYATQTALQMIHHPKPYTMTTMAPGDPRDIFWRNVGLSHKAKRSGFVAAMAASAGLCLFWSVPMAVISSLTELSTLKAQLPKLAAWLNDKPGMERVFALIAPLILLFFNEAILPSVLKYFATWEGHVSSSMLEASLFVKLGYFMIIQTFFVSAISGGITAELTNILEKPEAMIDLLANSLPAQSSYFIQVALAQTFFLQSVEILRLYPLFLAGVRRFVGPRLTAKERQRSWGWFSTLEDPPDFWHAETFAQLILLYMVAFVYSPIAPITSFILLFCFLLLESGYRYQFIHNYPRGFDTGGRLWKYFIRFTLVSMVVAQLTLMGLLALKQSPYAGPALGPLLALTILFIFYINANHTVVSEYLPTRECYKIDMENNAESPMNMDFCRDAFLQPSLQPQINEPVFESVGDEKDCLEGDSENTLT